MKIVSVVLEACDWLYHRLSGFEVLPEKGKPVNEWRPIGKGWQNVVDGIREAVQTLQTQMDVSLRESESPGCVS